jgi:hypothetical protein
MPNTEEQRLDVIDTCRHLLDGILKPFAQTDDTPEGRMIIQLKWLTERAANHDLALPVDRGMLATLLYVYTNGELCNLATSPKEVHDTAERYLNRLIALTEEAQLLLKPTYYPYAIRMIDALSNLLLHAPRPLNLYEQGLIGELAVLKRLLSDGKIEPPLMSYLPAYPNFRKVYRLKESTLDDIRDGKYLCETVANLLFEGIRPDTWRTPEEADRITRDPAALY